MAARDWFRNEQWDPRIEADFYKKLRRSRGKAQRLCTQAGHLTETYPEVALRLVQEYFAMKDEESYDFHLSSALLSEGRAYRAMGRVEDAVQSFLRALDQERKFPHILTVVWSDFAILVATKNIASQFDQALRALEERKPIVVFPLDLFHWHAANALIRAARGQGQAAREHANHALDAAQKDHSGFRHHPKVGLVGESHEQLKTKLEQLVRG